MNNDKKISNALRQQILLAILVGLLVGGSSFADDFIIHGYLPFIIVLLIIQILMSVFYWKRLHSLLLFIIPSLCFFWLIVATGTVWTKVQKSHEFDATKADIIRALNKNRK